MSKPRTGIYRPLSVLIVDTLLLIYYTPIRIVSDIDFQRRSMAGSVENQGIGSSGAVWCGRKIEGIVFDVDGTLTDSIEAYYEVFREATARFGIHIKREDVLEPMATGSLIWDRVIPGHIADRDEKTRQIMNVIPQIFREVFQRVKPFPGLAPVLGRLKEKGIRLGALTSSRAVAVRPLYDHSLSIYFKVIMTHEDGFLPKPAPDGILECLRRMEIHPNRALTVGDSPLDIRAGKAAGTLTIGVLSGIGNRAQLEAEEPAAILEDVVELLSSFDFNPEC
jgi:HAD superfamily hydrolase (TIGR01509 family)